MSKGKRLSFKKIYISYLSIFLLMCISFFIFIQFVEVIPRNITIETTLLFIISILTLGVSFVYSIRKKLHKVFDTLDNMVSNAINEENSVIEYDETLISSLESKMLKYMKITKANKKAIEEERNKVKALVADISHQTKTPISNILLYSQLVLEKGDIDLETKDILLDIRNQSERLNFLIQSLIKMSRLENGIITPYISKTKLKDVIHKSIEEIYINANQKQIEIIVECDSTIDASIDLKWTVEAIVNILENSIKYSKKERDIVISVTSYELFKKIDIKDQGIGIEDKEINNIFKRFYRCKNAKQYEGVGIGLYLSREIISLQGGYIKVSSEIEVGSTFSIFLPS